MAAKLFGGSTDEAKEFYEAVRSDADETQWYKLYCLHKCLTSFYNIMLKDSLSL